MQLGVDDMAHPTKGVPKYQKIIEIEMKKKANIKETQVASG